MKSGTQVQQLAKQTAEQDLKEITKLKLEFMQLMSVNKYDEAEIMSEKILRIDPNNKTMKQFKLFLSTFKNSMKIIDKVDSQNNDQNDWEYEEEDHQNNKQSQEEEEEEEIDELPLKPEEEEAQGYGYYDPTNANYDDKLYQEQKKIFFDKLKEGDDIKTSLMKAQQMTSKTTKPTIQQTLKTQPTTKSQSTLKITNQKSTVKLTR